MQKNKIIKNSNQNWVFLPLIHGRPNNPVHSNMLIHHSPGFQGCITHNLSDSNKQMVIQCTGHKTSYLNQQIKKFYQTSYLNQCNFMIHLLLLNTADANQTRISCSHFQTLLMQQQMRLQMIARNEKPIERDSKLSKIKPPSVLNKLSSTVINIIFIHNLKGH